MIYKPKSGANFNQEEAAALGEIFERIGDVTPAAVVDAARPVESPIHPLFTWDDTVAAEKCRRMEASHHIRHLEVVIKVEAGREVSTRAFHPITVESGEVYRHALVVRSSEEMSAQVVERALRELMQWEEKYREYVSIFAPVFKAISLVREARQ